MPLSPSSMSLDKGRKHATKHQSRKTVDKHSRLGYNINNNQKSIPRREEFSFCFVPPRNARKRINCVMKQISRPFCLLSGPFYSSIHLIMAVIPVMVRRLHNLPLQKRDGWERTELERNQFPHDIRVRVHPGRQLFSSWINRAHNTTRTHWRWSCILGYEHNPQFIIHARYRLSSR